MIENHLDIGGGVVFWMLTDDTRRERLQDGLARLGLEKFLPEARPDTSILRDALDEQLGGSRVLIRPLAHKDGFAVVREDRGEEQNEYRTELVARMVGGALDLQPWDDRAAAIQESMHAHACRIPAVQVSQMLVKMVEHLGGTRLRPSGAVYWIPGNRLDEWMKIVQAVEQASDRPAAVYLLRHQLDTEAVRAVRDAVINEIEANTSRISADVLSGDLGTRALETRQQQIESLREKVLLYEDILNIGLTQLHQAIDKADQVTVTASLMLSSRQSLAAHGMVG
ncbi:MAG: DUF6744 family protein [Zavarzinella sp.]